MRIMSDSRKFKSNLKTPHSFRRILGGGGWQWRALSRAVDDGWDVVALNGNDSGRWQSGWRQSLFHSVSLSVVLSGYFRSDRVWEPGPHSCQLPAKETAPEMWTTSSQASAKPWFLHPRQSAWNKWMFLMDSCDWEPRAWGRSLCDGVELDINNTFTGELISQ